MYGVEGAAIRLHEQQLRSTAEVLTRAFEIDDRSVAMQRRNLGDRRIG